MMPAAAKIFDEYAQHIFIPHITSQPRSVSRIDLVWDTYKDDSLKGTARAKHGKGVRTRVVGKAAVSGNWQTFCGLTATRRNYSVYCPRSSFRRSGRKKRKLSSPVGRGCSTHSYCRMSTLWPHTATKKLMVVHYCAYHKLNSMTTTRYSFALLTPTRWSWLCLP